MNTIDNIPRENDEIDLLKLFKYIERLFSRIVRGFKAIFAKIFNILLLFITTAIKYFWILGIVVLLSFFIIKSFFWIEGKVYVSNMLVKQNYNSGELMYNSIKGFNELAKGKRYEALSKEFKIPLEKVSGLKKFEIESNISQSELINLYNEYSKTADSLSKLSFLEFEETFEHENYPLQTITVYSKDESIFNLIEKPILSRIQLNAFFQKEKDDEIKTLNNKLQALEANLKESSKLQDKYLQFLDKYYEGISNSNSNSSDVNLNINEGSVQKNSELTKEYELFNNNNAIKLEIAELKNTISKKEAILRVQKGFSSPTLYKKISTENLMWILLGVSLLTLLFLLFKELGYTRESVKNKFIEK